MQDIKLFHPCKKCQFVAACLLLSKVPPHLAALWTNWTQSWCHHEHTFIFKEDNILLIDLLVKSYTHSKQSIIKNAATSWKTSTTERRLDWDKVLHNAKSCVLQISTCLSVNVIPGPAFLCWALPVWEYLLTEICWSEDSQHSQCNFPEAA